MQFLGAVGSGASHNLLSRNGTSSSAIIWVSPGRVGSGLLIIYWGEEESFDQLCDTFPEEKYWDALTF